MGWVLVVAMSVGAPARVLAAGKGQALAVEPTTTVDEQTPPCANGDHPASTNGEHAACVGDAGRSVPVESGYRYDTEYVFSATRDLQHSGLHPQIAVAIVPVTLAVDLFFLPFALILGCVGK